MILERQSSADAVEQQSEADATEQPFRVVYSGDCRPTRRLVEAGRGATILIHDATFDGGMIEDAKKKKHSTIPEALTVGVDMGAEYTILSHFSARYAAPSTPAVSTHA